MTHLSTMQRSLRHLTRRISMAFWLLSEKRRLSGSQRSSRRSKLPQFEAMVSISWSTWMLTPSFSAVPMTMILQVKKVQLIITCHFIR